MGINKNRLEPLDSLRGIAALGVVFFHFTSSYRQNVSVPQFPEYLDYKYGFYGVPLFFIISGFVIFMTVNKVNSVSEFIYRRFIRLYPTFWICLIITFFVVNLWGLLPQYSTSWQDAAFNLTMFYRSIQFLKIGGHIKDVDQAYWSLLPELQFYFLIVLVLLFKQLKNIKWVCLLWLGLIIIKNCIHPVRFLGLFIDLNYGGFFIAGILFYKIAIEKEKTIWNHLFIFTTLIFNCYLYYKLNFEGTSGFLFIPLVYLIFYMFTYGYLNWLKWKGLLFLGTISYPLYLIHQNIGYTIIKQFEYWGFTGFYIVLITATFFIGIAAIITFYIEQPLLKKLRNLFVFGQKV